jgi:3-dehydroquinate synthase/2-deoxy-scyllo-inosose synthase
MKRREIAIGHEGFPYFFGFDCLEAIGAELARYDADRFLVVTDETVLGLYGEQFLPALENIAPVHLLSQPPGEEMKSLSCLVNQIGEAIAAGATRRSVVVVFGGGVPGNLGGMVAALLFRGVRLVHVPTTTVAAMDSVISLKQAVNSRQGKNHIGCYHRPEAVYTDVTLMQSLPERELRSGLCEATKNCLAIRPEAVDQLREAAEDPASTSVLLWLLEESLAAKLSVMADDATERRSGLVLEYGHTIGHAVEISDQRVSGSDGISHGEAVGLGMVAASRIAHVLGALDAEAVKLHEELVATVGAPVTVPEHLDLEEVVNAVRADSKRGFLSLDEDEVAMVLLSDLGKPLGSAECPLIPVSIDVIEHVLHDLHPAFV